MYPVIDRQATAAYRAMDTVRIRITARDRVKRRLYRPLRPLSTAIACPRIREALCHRPSLGPDTESVGFIAVSPFEKFR
jgi:hypothetical protein